MTLEEAKSIPLAQILEKIAHMPTKQKGENLWFSSPLRNERTPSFTVNTHRNVWYDFGESKGGSNIDFVCAYLESTGENSTFADALRWLKNMTGNVPFIKPVERVRAVVKEQNLIIRDNQHINHPALMRYVDARGIPLPIAQKYLDEVRVFNKESSKSFFALGWKNEDEGTEIRNQFFKGCVGAKNITFVRGALPKPPGVHIFEGLMDYLSFVAIQKNQTVDDDAIILNSLSCIGKATPYIQNYGYRMAHTWMDNDTAGKKATLALAEFFQTENELIHRPMNSIYEKFKDLNEWHMHQSRLKL